jgi:hypothetical protein
MTDIKHLDAGKLNVRRDGPELCLSSAAGSAMRRWLRLNRGRQERLRRVCAPGGHACLDDIRLFLRNPDCKCA